MNSIAKILVAATLSTFSIAAAHADQTMKPIQAISFHDGSKDAVGYFVSEGKACNLVVTSADANSAPERFKSTIEGGKSIRYDLATGKQFEFTCKGEGQAMIVRSLAAVSSN